ncbi:MAG: PH domain-containing protein [bacterium]|nr:PH domain-containing protein [bacterium]
MSEPTLTENEIFALERPESSLLTYYFLQSLLLGPFFFVPLIPLFFRYHTLRYRFDEEGVSMRWGILFRREINLTYARIQDIHLASNLVERWLGLARIEIQTASGSAKAEMTIEGLAQFQALRDFLYGKMRGARHDAGPRKQSAAADREAELDPVVATQLTATLHSVAEELRALRLAFEERRAAGEEAGDA